MLGMQWELGGHYDPPCNLNFITMLVNVWDI